MRRLSQTLAAAGVALSVACASDAPTAPRTDLTQSARTSDGQLVRMARAAASYLQNLRDGHAGASLNDTQKRKRLEFVERFINATDSAIVASRLGSRAAMSVVPETEDPEMPSEPPSGGIFVESGTFTDLCLTCKNA